MSIKRTTALTVAAAVAGAVSAVGIAGAVHAQDQVQCFGISKAGENDCASAAGIHSCAGQSAVDYSFQDFKLVESDLVCAEHGGQLEASEGINEELAG